jgi:Fe-S oxidoreductase
MGIAEARTTIRSCRYCFLCRYNCPTFMATKLESVTPRGFALLLMEVDQGRKDWTPESVARFYQCTQCGLCREICEYHWPEDELVRHARESIVAAGAAPANVTGVARELISKVTPTSGALAGFSPPARTWAKPQLLYFAGCQALVERTETVQANLKLLEAAGVEWDMLEEEICCGAALDELGYADEARQAAQRIAERIAARRPDILLTGCTHCLRAFREYYPAWQVELPPGIQILHTSQYFYTLIKSGALHLRRNQVGIQVAYHDPCQLGRKLGIYDEPRQLISAVTGANPLELFHNRELAECCGAGALMHLTQPDVSRWVARLRLERVLESGASTLVTACQDCKTAFLSCQDGVYSHLKIMELSELLSDSVVERMHYETGSGS